MTASAVACAGTGFLLAVVWFDLMFDVQVLRRPPTDEAVESIATYYRRVTTDARPMNLLVAAAMVVTLGAVVAELAGDTPTWAAVSSLVLLAVPVALARVRTVPGAVRLGSGAGDPAARHRLAVAVARDHVLVFVLLVALLAVQLVAA